MANRACLILLLATTALAAADWPQWRGPERSGVAVDAPPLRSDLGAELQATWRVELPPSPKKPPYYGSPVGAEGRVYFHGTAVAPDQAADVKKPELLDVLLCVDLANGKEIWRQALPAGTENKQGAPNAPCIGGSLVHAFAADGTLRAYDAASGAVRWEQALGLDKKPGNFTACPLRVGELVIVNDKRLAAYDAASGERRWLAEADSQHNSPALWRHQGQPVVITGGKTLRAVAVADGRILWEAAGVGGPASPVVAGDTLVRLAEGQGLAIHTLTATGLADEKLVPFETAGGGHNASTPVLHEGRAYAQGKTLVLCVDTSSGAIVWQVEAKGDAKPSPILAGDRLLVGGKSGGLLLLAAADGSERAKAKLKMAGCSSFALVDGWLVWQDGRSLCAADLRAR